MMDELDTYLADSALFTADKSTRLVVLITRWDAIGTTTVTIEGGSAGQVSGHSYDPEKERRLIADRARNIIPFYTFRAYQEKVAAMTGGGRNVPLGY